jgi:hypothetical protein
MAEQPIIPASTRTTTLPIVAKGTNNVNHFDITRRQSVVQGMDLAKKAQLAFNADASSEESDLSSINDDDMEIELSQDSESNSYNLSVSSSEVSELSQLQEEDLSWESFFSSSSSDISISTTSDP